MVEKRKKKKGVSGRPVAAVLGLALPILFVSQIILANSLSSRGQEISQLEGEKDELLSEQSLLGSAVATLGSLERVRADAMVMGMIEGGENFDYLVPPKVAYNQ